jgi:hypothetical protein
MTKQLKLFKDWNDYNVGDFVFFENDLHKVIAITDEGTITKVIE